MTTKIWLALHNPMIEESVPQTISVHRTESGARTAIDVSRKNVIEERQKFMDSLSDEDVDWYTRSFGDVIGWVDRWNWWGVVKMDIQD